MKATKESKQPGESVKIDVELLNLMRRLAAANERTLKGELTLALRAWLERNGTRP